jgi:hypothetical protein
MKHFPYVGSNARAPCVRYRELTRQVKHFVHLFTGSITVSEPR